MDSDVIAMRQADLLVAERTEHASIDSADNARLLKGFPSCGGLAAFTRIKVPLGNSPSSVSPAPDQKTAELTAAVTSIADRTRLLNVAGSAAGRGLVDAREHGYS
jgi:hypothetical protein